MKYAQIDSTLIMDKFYVDLFNKNQDRGTWKYTTANGTEVRASDAGYRSSYPYYSYYLELTPPYDYYTLIQFYDANGNIIKRGKLSWEKGSKIGNWEYYENGVKTVVNEEKYGKLTYEELISKLESRGVLDRKTGKNRKNLRIYFSPKDDCWMIHIEIMASGANIGKARYIQINKDTGHIIEDKTMPLILEM